jgi:TonB family protein
MLFVLCLLCILLLGVSALPVVSQESKPDEGAKRKVFRAGVDGVGVPVCIHCPQPAYSEKARADKLEGSVLLDVTVTPEGKAAGVILVRSLGKGLDEKRIEAVKSWKFKPAKDSTGKPVAVSVQVEITFHLYK